MANIRLDTAGAVPVSRADAAVGITDLHVITGADGPILITATRGDGWATAYTLSDNGAEHLDRWKIDDSLLQLESTSMAVLQGDDGPHLLLAGLAGDSLTALPLGSGSRFFTSTDGFNASGLDMSTISEISVTGAQALVGLRGGGLSILNFDGDGVTARTVSSGNLPNSAVSGVTTLESGGTLYGFATYGRADALAAFTIASNGRATLVSVKDADDLGSALAGAETLHAVELAGQPYVIVAAADSGALSVFALEEDGLRLTDQVLDTRDTRFADAAHLDVAEVDGRLYIAAAGSDSGISIFTLMPSGRLHHMETTAATVDTPLKGLTDITLTEIDGDLHIYAATQAAPYLVSFRATGLEAGETRLAGAGGETLEGTRQDDVLVGGAGDDVLDGAQGEDILMDGPGADTLTGGSGADVFIFVNDNNTDSITDFRPGHDKLDLTGLPGLWDPDQIEVLRNSTGAELRYRGEVIMVQSYDGKSLDRDDILENLLIEDRVAPPKAQGQMIGTMVQDRFMGTDAADAFDGLSGADTMMGEGGDDTLMGSDGNDRLSGGFDQDKLHGGAGMDVITGDAGFDTIHGDAGGDFLNGGGQADLVYGGDGNDRILGETGFDLLYGDAGNDTLLGGDSADRLYGGDGDDDLRGGVNVGLTVDGLFGEGGNDTLQGDGGFDFLDGGAGDDSLDGGKQADNLYGRSGNDTLEGGDGLDRLFGGSGDDVGRGGDGNDGLFGEQGNDTLEGGSGNDRFFGGSGNDVMRGESGNDTMHGGAGFDTITGGTGDDVMTGDFNADIFVFANGHGRDRIDDFEATNNFEKIDLSAITAITGMSDLISNHLIQSRSNIVIDTGSGGLITLSNVSADDLDENDFIF
ncbi:calcium-binding protein [Rhodobacteraceae bacterium KMM 6894]|nr:calcium-binding protein [Rhodobacteraceae bacterium KMM 6894]